jgi:hypothetical protein
METKNSKAAFILQTPVVSASTLRSFVLNVTRRHVNCIQPYNPWITTNGQISKIKVYLQNNISLTQLLFAVSVQYTCANSRTRKFAQLLKIRTEQASRISPEEPYFTNNISMISKVHTWAGISNTPQPLPFKINPNFMATYTVRLNRSCLSMLIQCHRVTYDATEPCYGSGNQSLAFHCKGQSSIADQSMWAFGGESGSGSSRPSSTSVFLFQYHSTTAPYSNFIHHHHHKPYQTTVYLHNTLITS